MAYSEFWETMKILVDRDFKRNIMDDIQDWVENFVSKRSASSCAQEEENESVIARNRRLSECSGIDELLDEEVRKFCKGLDLPKIDCRFSHPQIRSRLEKLMGTNRVSLTDRKYMQRLQERILEDYADSMDKRIRAREEEEQERVKNLVLMGKIPLDKAPPEMAKHPVMLIEKHCQKLIAERRAKIKIPKVKIPTYLYWDDTPDPESGLTIEKGHVFRTHGDTLCVSTDKYIQSTEEEDLEEGYMLTDEEYAKYKYEDPLIKELMDCENVVDMYEIADEIIGVLKMIEDHHHDDQVSMISET